MEVQAPALPPIQRILFEHGAYGITTDVGVMHGIGVVATKGIKFVAKETKV